MPIVAIGRIIVATILVTLTPAAKAADATATLQGETSQLLQSLQQGSLSNEKLARLTSPQAGELLSHCALSGDLGCINRFAAAGQPIDAPNAKGTTALMVAISAGNLAAAEALIAQGADPGASTPFGTPEQYALDLGDPEMIRAVVEDPQATLAALLRVAIEHEDSRAVDEALRAGAGVNATLPGGGSPLLVAIAAGALPIAESLLHAGASTAPADPEAASPLAAAVMLQDRAMVKLLCDNGADPNLLSAGVTPLSLAVMGGSPEIVELLLDAGADPNTPNADGSRPALVAAVAGFPELGTLLGDAGLELLAAVGHGDRKRIAALIATGADLGVRDSDGNPVLLLAIAKGDIDLVRLLLDGGADPLLTGTKQASALHVAMAIEDQGKRFDMANAIVTAVLAGPNGDEKLAQLLSSRDSAGRSAVVVLASRLRAHPPADGTDLGQYRRENWQLDVSEVSRWFAMPETARLANLPDETGASPMIAAVLSDNDFILAAMKGIEPAALPDGSSLAMVARASEAWASLAWLPDDRPVPPGIARGMTLAAGMALQDLLKRSGYYSEAVDGKIGPATQFAAVAFLREREKELIAMARTGWRPDLDFETWDGVTENATRTLRLRLPAANCTWVIQHWHETRPDWGQRFVGCTRPSDGGPWSANGFGLLTLTDGTERLILTGPKGFEDAASFDGSEQ